MADLTTALSTVPVASGGPGHPARHNEDRDVLETLRAFTQRPGNRAQVNRLYVNPTTGNDSNSGLTAGAAKATIPGAFAALKANGPVLSGSWVVTLAAGTYTASGQLIGLLTPDDYLTIEGPDVAGGVPTAVIDPGAEAAYGLWFGHKMRVRVRNVKVQNVTGSTVAAGVVLDFGTYGWLDNVHATNCTWAGVNVNVGGRLIMGGGILAAMPNYGVRVYASSTATIGYNGVAVTFDDCTAGVIYQGFSYGHTDDCVFTGCDYGLLAEMRSHSSNYRNTYTNVNVGWQTSAFSTIGSDAGTTWTGSMSKSRHRAGFATGDSETAHRAAMQYRDDVGTGKWAWGYPDWVLPFAKHQFTGETQAPFDLSPYTPVTVLEESGGNTIHALAAPDAAYSALWFGNATNPQAAALRHSSGLLDFFFSGTGAFRIRSTDFYPLTNDVKNLGRDTFRWLNVFAKQFRPGTAGANAPIWTSGTGSPEGVVTARVGSLYTREDGAAGTTLWVKETGTGNTGWVSK